MPQLPSKYSDEGLSANDANRIITTGTGRKKGVRRPDFQIKKLSDLPQQEKQPPPPPPSDEDITMVGTEDFNEVENIIRLVTSQRQGYEQQQDSPISILDESLSAPPSQKLIFLVIDTNFILSHLDILDNLLKLYKQSGSSYQLVIPRTTIQELDGLKNSNNDNKRVEDAIISNHSISQLARWANDWCYRNLAASNPLIRGQKFDERIDHLTKKDDSILDCCLFLQKKFPKHLVILLSNDKNFCVKLLTNGVLTISYRSGMNADLIVRTIILENLNRGNALKWDDDHQHTRNGNNDDENIDPMEIEQEIKPAVSHSRSQYLIKVQDFEQGCSIVYDEVLKLVISLVDKIMYEEYGDDLDIIRYEPPTNFHDIFELIITNWVLVFKTRIQSVNFKQRFSQNGRVNSTSSLDFVQFPAGPQSLRTFLSFWRGILDELYISKTQRDRDALEIFARRWDDVLRQIV